MEKYGYELWYDANCIMEDHGFDSEEEAIEEARSAIEDRMDLWMWSIWHCLWRKRRGCL